MSELCFGARVSEDFRNRILEIGEEFGWNRNQVNYLMACMAFESGFTFSPSVVNQAGSGATGLIQFMPSTAKGLGTTTQALAEMTDVEQLEYVRRYFLPYHKRTKTLSDMYMAILMPKYISYPEDAVLFREGTIAYKQNRGLDSNNDGIITKAEASERVRQSYLRGLAYPNSKWVK